ncbi:unnamed protein product [Sympodiomycopsis kandeliae]
MTNSDPDATHKGFVVREPEFKALIGETATLRLLLRDAAGTPLFHEAGVYLARQRSVYISSNRLPCKVGRQQAFITRVPIDKIPCPPIHRSKGPSILDSLEGTSEGRKLWQSLEIMTKLPDELAMPNGATNVTDRNGNDAILWCAQGRHDLDGQGIDDVESALICMSLDRNGHLSDTQVVVDQFQRKNFSSLNDVVVHKQSGCVFFTDPDYGIGQSFKKNDVEYAPNALYAWHPPSGTIRLIDDRYDQPNGVTFVPDPCHPLESGKGLLVVTDTGRFTFEANENLGTLKVDDDRPACIYTYRVEPAVCPDLNPYPRVHVNGRRLLWDSECGVPDGIHPDEQGNV